MKRIAIIGAGGWGTALSIALANNFERISLWVFEPELCRALTETRRNQPYLPGCAIPANVFPTTDLAGAVAGAELVLTAVPSQHVRAIYTQIADVLRPEQPLVSATKGLETNTQARMSEVIHEVLSPRFRPKVAVLSGPTFAREVARGTPTAVVLASEDAALARSLQRALATSLFRIYTNSDVCGVELCGSVKNVIALAAGVCEGLELGSNTRAAVITRGLSEISRLAAACGGRRETAAGLAGLGDLVLTCTGAASRNHWAGVELGRGRSLEEILRSTPMVVEGVHTAAATVALARRNRIEMPITEQVHAILYGGRKPLDAVRELMERSLKEE